MQYFVDYNNQVQWHPPPVFCPQWDTLLSQGHFIPGQTPTESVVEPEDNIMFWGSSNDENHIMGVTDQNAHYMPGPYATGPGEYEELPQMPGYLLQDDVDDSLDVFNGQFSQFPDFSLMEETFNINDYPFVAESPPQPDYILLDSTYDNMFNVDCSVYGSVQAPYDYDSESPGSSVSSDASLSFPGVYNLDFYGNLSTNFLPAPNDVDPPTFENHPAAYDYDSPSSSEWSSAAPITALGAFESGSSSISTYPTCPDCPACLYDNAPAVVSSTTYDNSLNGALGVDCQFDEWKETVDGTHETQAPEFWFVGQGVDAVAIVPAENENTENDIIPQRTWNERSAWEVNSFCKEGIEPFTYKSDHDTGAGPSTGSGVAAAMLDIEQAWHGQRDDAANISADMTERRKGKRKAEDAPDAPEASKRLRMEPSAPSMGDTIADQDAEDPAICLGNFQQKRIREFRFIFAPETANGSEGQLPISGQSSTFMTMKIEMNGTLTARSTVVARDSHANRRPN